MRQRGRFAGFSLYVSNITDRHSGDLCYKDGPVLPPLDFHTNCITLGRYVIFYNERLIETKYPVGYETANVFTELCEVIVTGICVFCLFKFTIKKNKLTNYIIIKNTNFIRNGCYIIFYYERTKGKIYPKGYENRTVYIELCDVCVSDK